MTEPHPAFARDPSTAAYYEQRAGEYDEWYLGQGRFLARDRSGWGLELDRVVELVRKLPDARTLDVACGSGFLTRNLRGLVIGLDQSPAMVALTQSRLTNGVALVGDALDLPFADRAFNRVLTGHFYGHLPEDERRTFLAEARRVATELIVVDSALRPGSQLASEIGGQQLFDGRWFVAPRTLWSSEPAQTGNRQLILIGERDLREDAARRPLVA